MLLIVMFYEVIAPGFKYNMPDIAAAIGIHQLKRLPDFQVKREKMANVYFDAFADLPLEMPVAAANGDVHAWHLFPIKIKPEAGVERARFIERMAEFGVGCSVHFIPLHLHPYWRDTYNLTPDMFPVAQKIFEQEVSLPLYTKMTEDDLARVITGVKQVLADA
jgi:dTDP-4-amino-4,6-dideoxygalactose transaminase